MTAARTSLTLGLFLAGTATLTSAQPLTPTTLTMNAPAEIYAGVTTEIPFTVSAGPGDVPTGIVLITSSTDANVACRVAVSTGRCSVLTWTTGELRLFAQYSGDDRFLGSSDGRVVVVLGGAYATRTEIGEIVPGFPMAGEPVHVSASVSPCLPPSQCGGMSGPVTFTDPSDASTTCTTKSPLNSAHSCSRPLGCTL